MADTTSEKMMSIIVSIFGTIFAVNLLYEYSDQKGLWIVIVFLFDIFAQVLEIIIASCCFTRHEASDIDKVTLDRLILVLRFIISFVMVRLVLDLVIFLMAVTNMVWYDYVNITAVALIFMLVIIARINIF